MRDSIRREGERENEMKREKWGDRERDEAFL